MPEKKCAAKTVKMTFPQQLIKEPVTFEMAKKYDITPNIRRAKVTETVGELVLELWGREEDVDAGIKYMIGLGVQVEPIEGDIIE